MPQVVDPDMIELWGDEQDRYSFEDSDRFEEDSECSSSTEPESVCNNWRGWKRPPLGNNSFQAPKKNLTDRDGKVPMLYELSARCVAAHIPFELVEHVYPPVPEQLQLRIAYWSFPDNEEDIRLYSCLANSSAEEFYRGEYLFKAKAVKDPLQIGFHLSATVCPPSSTPGYNHQRGQFNVAVVFDRRRITSCNCTCNSNAYWCSHVVAVCLYRIHQPEQVRLRAPVSESLSRLHRDQLQKFAQYLISELPQQILPTAQRILDDLLSSQPSTINSVCGAPDPTAGASVNDQTSWYLDEKMLHENIKKILIKFCVPAPIVFSDVNYLSTTAPPAAAEWTSLLRPLRGREPEGMWNLLSVVREMYKRSDRNALPLLQIITEECMACEQVMVWWFNTKVALNIGVSSGGKHSSVNSNAHAAQHACASLCDELVVLWRLAALNPALSPEERILLCMQFNDWHLKIVEKVEKSRLPHTNNAYQTDRITKNMSYSIEVFSGFKPAITACQLDWEDYPIPGVTYQGSTASWLSQPFTCFKTSETKPDPVNSSQAVLNPRATNHNYCSRQPMNHRSFGVIVQELREFDIPICRIRLRNELDGPGLELEGSGNRSSVSSEGFYENEQDQPNQEEDSGEAGRSDSSTSSCSGAHATRQLKHPPASESPSSGSDSDISKQDPPNPEQPSTSAEPRRLSKDDSLSSDSQQSSDEYYMYYYDPKSLEKEANKEDKKEEEKPSVVVVSGPKNPWDMLFARAEGLHAHGHNREACILGVRLAEELLANPPNLMVDLPPMQTKGKRKKINPVSHQLSVLASDTLAKCCFLCTVLAENPEYYHLAFRVGLYGLEMPRPPATTKPLEVKLFNQESEIVNLLKRITLGESELAMIRERAQLLKDNALRTRGEALLPLTLASYILDALTMPTRESRCQLDPALLRPSDKQLGFEAATAALGLKTNVSEADHPLLCEGTRRQRGELAVTLLVHYKDDPHKIAQIMEKLLDREVHQLIKTPILWSYYTSHPPVKSVSSSLGGGSVNVGVVGGLGSGVSGLGGLGVAEVGAGCSDGGGAGLDGGSGAVRGGLGMAELEPCLPPIGMGLGPAPGPAPMAPQPRPKDAARRFKGKRSYPSIPNQPSEAGAHFMFELAKTVLIKAGGNSSTSLFTQASTNQNHHGAHRALHMCAFQLGLYALGLHNCVSPNWLSRTYSSHVSWITGQAMEIGAPAISFLQDTWEGHLTPPEAASMADRASRGCDRNMVRAAAELALSCLPHATALNANEIQRAILQCKELSDRMLEQSCLTVESAAKGGGVYPEVLFQVAKYWYELYHKNSPQGEMEDGGDGSLPGAELNVAMSPSLVLEPSPPPPPPPPLQTPQNPQLNLPPFATMPYSLFTVAAPPHFHPSTLQHHPHQIALQTQMYHLPSFPYYHASPGPAPPHVFSTTIQVGPSQGQLALAHAQSSGQAAMTQSVVAVAPGHPPHHTPHPHPQQVLLSPQQLQRPPHPHPHPPHPTHPSHPQTYNPSQYRYLLAAYRVGMLAMETLARRVHDERPNTKYNRNPPYGEDIKWLLRIAQKLGTHYVHQFCVCVVSSIVSPFVLHDVAFEAAHYLGRGNSTVVMQHLRSSLNPLVQKCQQMYIQCLHQKLYHLSAAEHDEFINIVIYAKAAFQITPEGSQAFKDWLQSVRKARSCKKELWTELNLILQQTNGK